MPKITQETGTFSGGFGEEGWGGCFGLLFLDIKQLINSSQ